VHRKATAQIGQGKVGSAIPAIRGSEDRKEGTMLGYFQKLTVAERPPSWRYTASKHYDLADKRFRHGSASSTYLDFVTLSVGWVMSIKHSLLATNMVSFAAP
jgi:hypothetical protein